MWSGNEGPDPEMTRRRRRGLQLRRLCSSNRDGRTSEQWEHSSREYRPVLLKDKADPKEVQSTCTPRSDRYRNRGRMLRDGAGEERDCWLVGDGERKAGDFSDLGSNSGEKLTKSLHRIKVNDSS